MELTQIIIISLSILISFLILMFLKKLILKVLMLLLVVFSTYIAYQYYAQRDVITDVNLMFCNESESNIAQIKCKCFVQPIMRDLESRWTPEELINIKDNPLISAQEFLNSYYNSKEEINDCFEDNGESSNITEDIIQDIRESFIIFSNTLLDHNN